MLSLSLFAAVYWMILSGAFLPTVGVAAIGGVIAALVSWSLWPLGIVLVTGSLLGWLATVVWFVVYFALWRLRGGSEAEYGDLVAWGVGPAVAIVVALGVILIW